MNINVNSRQSADFEGPAHAISLLSRTCKALFSPSKLTPGDVQLQAETCWQRCSALLECELNAGAGVIRNRMPLPTLIVPATAGMSAISKGGHSMTPRCTLTPILFTWCVSGGVMAIGWRATPSPGPPRLIKTPVALHPLP